MTESLLASSSEALFLAPLVTVRDDTIGQKKKKKNCTFQREKMCVYSSISYFAHIFK